MSVALVVAASDNDVIGVSDELPWHLPEDLKRFKALTYGHAIIIGSTTQRSIVRRLGRPLQGRFTVVLSRKKQEQVPGLVSHAWSLEQALELADRHRAEAQQSEFFVAGGASV